MNTKRIIALGALVLLAGTAGGIALAQSPTGHQAAASVPVDATPPTIYKHWVAPTTTAAPVAPHRAAAPVARVVAAHTTSKPSKPQPPICGACGPTGQPIPQDPAVVVMYPSGNCGTTDLAEATADHLPVIPANEVRWCTAPYFNDPYLCSMSDPFSPPVSQGCPPVTTTTLPPPPSGSTAGCAGNGPGSCQHPTTTTTLPPAGDTSACNGPGYYPNCTGPGPTTTTTPPTTTAPSSTTSTTVAS